MEATIFLVVFVDLVAFVVLVVLVVSIFFLSEIKGLCVPTADDNLIDGTSSLFPGFHMYIN